MAGTAKTMLASLICEFFWSWWCAAVRWFTHSAVPLMDLLSAINGRSKQVKEQ